jgi:hypothetical protein
MVYVIAAVLVLIAFIFFILPIILKKKTSVIKTEDGFILTSEDNEPFY